MSKFGAKVEVEVGSGEIRARRRSGWMVIVCCICEKVVWVFERMCLRWRSLMSCGDGEEYRSCLYANPMLS